MKTTRRPRPRLAALAAGAIAIICVPGCQRREPPEVTLARSTAAYRRAQIETLEGLIAKAEKGEIVTSDQIAIGISEEVMKDLLNASLPREVVVASRVKVRIESAVAVFRGGKAGLLLRATASGVNTPGASATLDIGGGVNEFRFENGKLLARVELSHFAVIQSSMGDLASDVLHGLVLSNAALIQAAIPALEIPVQIEQAIKISGLTEGAVVAKPGSLPLAIAVNQVIPVNQRLWVLLNAKAGPWQAASPVPAPAPSPAPAKAAVK